MIRWFLRSFFKRISTNFSSHSSCLEDKLLVYIYYTNYTCIFKESSRILTKVFCLLPFFMKPTLVGAVNSEICAAASALVLCSSITWVADDFESDPWETSASGFKDRMEILLLPFTSNVTQNEDWQLSKFMRWIAYYFFLSFSLYKKFLIYKQKKASFNFIGIKLL